MTRHDDAFEDPEDEVFRIPTDLPAGADGDLRRERWKQDAGQYNLKVVAGRQRE